MLAVILGTRPEIIKCAPIIMEAKRKHIPVGIIHTGQHYTPELDDIFFQDLNLDAPIANLHVGSHAAPQQIGLMMQRLSDILVDLKPKAVMVEGDTNSVLAGALTAYKLNMPVAHLEAGLRSDDWDMPEEANRVLTDRISRWLFAPTEVQRERLNREGIKEGVHVVGNTVVDAALHYVKVAYAKSDIAERLQLANRRFALLTMHRPSNVDEKNRLAGMITALGESARRLDLNIVFPIHPRTANNLKQFGIKLPDNFITSEPVGYLDLLRLQSSADIVLTDSGGIQEEACSLRVPCVTLRANTERPESIDVGANVLHYAADADSLTEAMMRQMKLERTWKNPFGEGKTGENVMNILERECLRV